MNRRGFLATLLAAPIAGAAVLTEGDGVVLNSVMHPNDPFWDTDEGVMITGFGSELARAKDYFADPGSWYLPDVVAAGAAWERVFLEVNPITGESAFRHERILPSDIR